MLHTLVLPTAFQCFAKVDNPSTSSENIILFGWLVKPDLEHLSKTADQACFYSLLSQAPDAHFKALALSSAIPHAEDWLSVVPSSSLGLHFLGSIFACSTGWELTCSRRILHVLSVHPVVAPSGIITLVVEATGIVFIAMTLLEMFSFLPPSLWLWPHTRRCIFLDPWRE